MSEKRTQNKGTKNNKRYRITEGKRKASIGCGSGFLCFGYWSDRNRVMLNVADIRQTPKMVMKEYFELLSKGKYEEMYAFVSDTSGIEKKAFLEKNKNIYEGIQMSGLQVKFDKEKKKKDKEKTAVVSYQTKMETVAGEKAFYNEASLVKEKGGDWKLVWEPSLIFPELRKMTELSCPQFQRVGEIYWIGMEMGLQSMELYFKSVWSRERWMRIRREQLKNCSRNGYDRGRDRNKAQRCVGDR